MIPKCEISLSSLAAALFRSRLVAIPLAAAISIGAIAQSYAGSFTTLTLGNYSANISRT